MLRIFKPVGNGWANFSSSTVTVSKGVDSPTTRFSDDGSYVDIPITYIMDSKSLKVSYTAVAPNELQTSTVSASFANTNVAGDMLPLVSQPTIVVKGAADGSGTVSITSGTLNAGSPAGPIVLTYTTV